MKKALFLVAAFAALSATAQTYVQPYVKKDGTYVEGHFRSRANNTDLDNYSAPGNTNPYTGETRRPSYERLAPTRPVCANTLSGRYVCQ